MGYLSEGWFQRVHAMVANFKCFRVMYRRGIGLFCTPYTLVLASDSLVTLIYTVLIFIIMI